MWQKFAFQKLLAQPVSVHVLVHCYILFIDKMLKTCAKFLQNKNCYIQ